MALDRRWTRPSTAASSPSGGPSEKPPEGAIFLASGAVKVPAKTKSGYCLKVPQDYVATGDMNYPAITGALPRCEDVADETKKAFWQPLH
jgi:hypothetical protein